MLFPLLNLIEGSNGRVTAAEAANELADQFSLSSDARAAEGVYIRRDGRRSTFNRWRAAVRWVKQDAVRADLVDAANRQTWSLTATGHEFLSIAEPGVVTVVAVTDLGTILWADAISAMGSIHDQSVKLCFTSPPYPLVTQRQYGGDLGPWRPEHWVDTMIAHTAKLRPLLTMDGSLILGLGDCYRKGSPVLLPYQEILTVELIRRGWQLCGKTVHFNPSSALRTDWVTKTRERTNIAYETYFHFAPTTRPYSSTWNVLRPYSKRYQANLAKGGEVRKAQRGGSQMLAAGTRYARDNGGAIPHNVLQFGNSSANGHYADFCHEIGVPLCPAPMAYGVASHFVRLASSRGDTVFDPFAGSLQTAKACEDHGRRYIASERNLAFVQGGMFRLREATGACLIT